MIEQVASRITEGTPKISRASVSAVWRDELKLETGAETPTLVKFAQRYVNSHSISTNLRFRAASINVNKLITDTLALRDLRPEELTSCAMPANHRLRFDNDQRLAPTSPEFREPHPEEAICWLEWRTWMEPFVDCELLAQRQIFACQIAGIFVYKCPDEC